MTEIQQTVHNIATADKTQRLARYIAVGIVGLGINQGVLYFVTGIVGLSYVIGGTLSRCVSIFANYVMNDSWTWKSRGDAGAAKWTKRGLKYVATRIVGMGIGIAALIAFVELLDLHYLVANVFAVGVGILWGFAASERWVWRPDDAADLPSPVERIRAVLPSIDRSTLLVFGLAAVVFVAFSLYMVALFRGYRLTGSDFGSYVHMFSTTLDGEGFLIHGKYRVSHPQGSYWGAHFTLTLLAFLPIYALAPYPETLLVAKSFVLAASIPALWFVARTHLDNDRLSTLVVVSYALNPWLWSGWAFDFQEQSLLPILVFLAYYCYATDRKLAFLGVFSLALLTNEFAIIVLAGLLVGLLVAEARHGRLRDRGPVLVVALALAAVAKALSSYVIDRYSVVTGLPKPSVAAPLQQFVEGSRISIGSLVTNALSNPEVLWQAATFDAFRKLQFFLLLAIPVGYLFLSDEATLGALAPFIGFAWLLSGRSIYYEFGAHYPLYLLPVIYLGAVRVLDRLDVDRYLQPTGTKADGGTKSLMPNTRHPLGFVDRFWRRVTGNGRPGLYARVLAILLLVNMTAGFAIQWGTMKPAEPATDHPETLQAAIDSIPHEASLITQNDIFPHVADRPNTHYVVRPDMFNTYQEQYGTIAPQYVLYDRNLNEFWASNVVTAFGDRLNTEYGLVRYEDGIWLFKRGYEGPTTAFTSESGVEWVTDQNKWYPADSFNLGNAERTQHTIVSTDSEAGDTIWFGPYANLPPGRYRVTFSIETANVGEESPARVDVAVGDDHRVLTSKAVPATNDKHRVSLEFVLNQPKSKVEFRGHRAAAEGTVRFAGVQIEALGPKRNSQ